MTIPIRCAAAMLLAPLAAAQDATEILKRAAEAYRQIRTWDIEQTVVVETPGVAASRTEQRQRFVAVEGKHRWEEGAAMSVADGQYEWTYSSRTNRYVRREQGPVGGGPLPLGYWVPDAWKIKRARLVREESVTLDGAAVLTYVLAIEHDSTAGMMAGSPPDPPETLWIDKSRYLVVKKQRRTPPVFATQFVWTTALTKVSINEPVPDSAFTFVPPAGAMLEAPKPVPAPPPAPVRKKKR